MEQVYIKDKEGNKVLPITHMDAVRDSQGNTLTSLMGTFEDEVRGLVDTPHQEYVTVDAYSNLPTTGSKDTIYRISNYNGSTSQVDVSVYSEYAWDGTEYIFLSVKSQIGEVFDISAYNSNTEYVDLAAALGNDGANVPASIRRRGMSVKFVCNSDHKYVQYHLLKKEWSIYVNDWQCDNPQVLDIDVSAQEASNTILTTLLSGKKFYARLSENAGNSIFVNTNYNVTKSYCKYNLSEVTTVLLHKPVATNAHLFVILSEALQNDLESRRKIITLKKSTDTRENGDYWVTSDLAEIRFVRASDSQNTVAFPNPSDVYIGIPIHSDDIFVIDNKIYEWDGTKLRPLCSEKTASDIAVSVSNEVADEKISEFIKTEETHNYTELLVDTENKMLESRDSKGNKSIYTNIKFKKEVNFNDLVKTESDESSTYKIVICDPNNKIILSLDNNSEWFFSKLKSQSINERMPRGSRSFVVDANGNGDFESLDECIKATYVGESRNNPTTIFVCPGTYIMETGYGEDFYKNRNLSIIGTDKYKCIVRNDKGYYQQYKSATIPFTDNAPIKLGGNINIENLTIISTDDNWCPNPSDSESEAQHKSYCVHFDYGTSEEYVICSLKNCILKNDHYACVGCGNRGQLVFEDCFFENTMYDSTIRGCVYSHDSSGYSNTELIVKRCVLVANSGVAISVLNAYDEHMNLTFIDNVAINKTGGSVIDKSSYATLTDLCFGNNSNELNN